MGLAGNGGAFFVSAQGVGRAGVPPIFTILALVRHGKVEIRRKSAAQETAKPALVGAGFGGNINGAKERRRCATALRV